MRADFCHYIHCRTKTSSHTKWFSIYSTLKRYITSHDYNLQLNNAYLTKWSLRHPMKSISTNCPNFWIVWTMDYCKCNRTRPNTAIRLVSKSQITFLSHLSDNTYAECKDCAHSLFWVFCNWDTNVPRVGFNNAGKMGSQTTTVTLPLWNVGQCLFR